MPCLITIKGIWMFLWLDTVKKHVGHAHTSTLFTTNHSQRCYRSLVLQRFREWDIDDFRRCTLSECSQHRGDSNCLGVDYGWLWYNPKTLAWNRLKSGWWYTYPSEKYKFVNGKDDIPYMKWKIIHSCSKPPTRTVTWPDWFIRSMASLTSLLKKWYHLIKNQIFQDLYMTEMVSVSDRKRQIEMLRSYESGHSECHSNNSKNHSEPSTTVFFSHQLCFTWFT